MKSRCRGSGSLSRDDPGRAGDRPPRAAFPSRERAGPRRPPGRRRHRARRSRRRSRRFQRGDRPPAGAVPRARSPIEVSADQSRRDVDRPVGRRAAPTRPPSARSTALRDDQRRRRSADRGDRRASTGSTAADRGLQREPRAHTPRSSSPSCSARRSCCCSSTFRSIVIPIKAILLNLLCVGAAYGVLVAGLPARRASCSASPKARSSPGCRCSCSWSSSACRWTTTCSSSAACGRPTTAA